MDETTGAFEKILGAFHDLIGVRASSEPSKAIGADGFGAREDKNLVDNELEYTDKRISRRRVKARAGNREAY